MKTAKQTALLQSQFRIFTKLRLARRAAGGGNESNSVRGLAALGFVNHTLPQHENQELLKKVLLSDLPIGYTNRDGINAFHLACSRSNLKIVHKLINSGAVSILPIKPQARAHQINPRKRTRDGMSALHFCCAGDRDAVDLCTLVLNLMLKTSHMYDGTRGVCLQEHPSIPGIGTPKERLICELLLQKTNTVGLNVLGVCGLSSNPLVMEYLLAQLPSPNVGLYVLSQNTTSRHQSLVHIAANNCDYTMLLLFQNMGLPFDTHFTKDLDGRNPLHHLAMSKRASSTLQHQTYELLKQEYFKQQHGKHSSSSSSSNSSNGSGSGSGSGSEQRNIAVLQELLSQTTKMGETPLHLACNSGASTLARLLWKDGARWDARDGNGNTPLVLLLRHRFKSTRIMLLLKDILIAHPHSWFDQSLHRATGKSALVKACEWRNLPALQTMLICLPHQKCMHLVDVNGKTPVHHCSETAFTGGLQLLLEQDYCQLGGGEVDGEGGESGEGGGDKDGGSEGGGGAIAERHSLYVGGESNTTASGGNESSVLGLQDNDGYTPLMLAIGSNDFMAVDVILRAVVRIDRWNYAKKKIHPPPPPPPPPPLLLPPLLPPLQPLEPLQSLPSLEDTIGIPADTLSSQYPMLTEQLIRYQNNDGLTPLQISALLSDSTIMKSILDASIQCNVSRYILSSLTKEENNVLHCSAAGGSTATVELLATFDPNLTKHLSKQRNQKGKRPSDLAQYWKQHDVRELLLNLEHGKSGSKSRRGSTIVDAKDGTVVDNYYYQKHQDSEQLKS